MSQFKTTWQDSVVDYDDNRPTERIREFPRPIQNVMDDGVKVFNDIKHEKLPFPINRSKLETVLNYINMMAPNGGNLREIIGSDFVTSAGALTHIVKSLTNQNTHYACAVKRNGVIFLVAKSVEPVKHSARCLDNRNNGSFDNEYESERYNFEKYLMIPHTRNNDIRKFHQNILKATLSSTNDDIGIYYSADFGLMDNGEFIEVKGRSVLNEKWKNHISFIWYTRSIISDISKTFYLEAESQHGRKIKSMKTEQIPIAAINSWDPKLPINLLQKFLIFLKKELTEDNKPIEYNFDTKTITHVDPSQVDYLPKSFFERFH